MKNKMLAALMSLLFGNSAFAMTVNPNIYMAAGPATKSYFENLQKVQQAVNAVSSASLGEFQFNGAQVNFEDQVVTYFFHRYEGSVSGKTCWSQLSFNVVLAQQASLGPQFQQVRAELDCHSDQD